MILSAWYLLLLAPPYLALVVSRNRAARRLAGGSLRLQRRLTVRLGLHALAALCLILAAAGLQIPCRTLTQQLVVAADVSARVCDVATQHDRIAELLAALDAQNLDAALVVFGAAPATERPLQPLANSAEDAKQSTLPRPLSANDAHPAMRRLPDLTHLTTVVDPNGTDIAAAIESARAQFGETDRDAARGILLLSDFRGTRGDAQSAAAALNASGIDLLPTPAILGPSADVHIADVRAPESGQLGRALPIEVAVASQRPATVRVALWRQKAGGAEVPIDFKTVTLDATPGAADGELRRAVRFLDQPDSPGVAIYTARVSGTDGPLPGDITSNNQLSIAARIAGPSRWAVLAVRGSTLDRLGRDPARPLSVECIVYNEDNLPATPGAYENCAGILVDGFSATQLPEGRALAALSAAVDGGKALLALGGASAFGAGGHREGAWERLLPIEMTPEDDRTRTVLFVVDVSKSMDQKMGAAGVGVRKIDFAAEQLALAVQKLKPLDRVGLVAFSGSAQVVAPLATDPSRAAFLAALGKLEIQANTDLLAPLTTADEVLRADDAEEQLIVLLSDGVQTSKTPRESILAAARTLNVERRASNVDSDSKSARAARSLFTFGIGVDAQDADPAGEKLLRDLAAAGGGTYSPDFLRLARRLEQTFDAKKKDFYVRREPFALRAAFAHPALGPAAVFPELPFRNRVRAKPGAETLLWAAPSANARSASGNTASRRPDPLLALSGPQWPGVSRRAALALSMDAQAGTALLGSDAGRNLLRGLLAWLEARADSASENVSVQAEPNAEDTLAIDVRALDPVSRLPLNGRTLSASLAPALVQPAPGAGSPSLTRVPLHPSAPGAYRAIVPLPAQGVYRLVIEENGAALHERFVSVPFPAELRRFGTDRAAMQSLANAAGARSRVIETPRDLAEWASSRQSARDRYALAPWLIAAAIILFLAEVALRR